MLHGARGVCVHGQKLRRTITRRRSLSESRFSNEKSHAPVAPTPRPLPAFHVSRAGVRSRRCRHHRQRGESSSPPRRHPRIPFGRAPPPGSTPLDIEFPGESSTWPPPHHHAYTEWFWFRFIAIFSRAPVQNNEERFRRKCYYWTPSMQFRIFTCVLVHF